MRADLEDETALRHALRDCTTVFHAAALFKLWGSESEFDRANVEGTRRLLAVAKSSGVRSFVQIGAAAVVMGEPVPMLDVAKTRRYGFARGLRTAHPRQNPNVWSAKPTSLALSIQP